MPTGYTACIEEGATFEEFILGCARAFGACISMRDKPLDKPIPDQFKESSYDKERVQEYIELLEKYESMPIEQAEIEAEKEYSTEKKRIEDHLSEIDRKEKLYVDMLEKVREWLPPTKDHQNLKSFMLEQIDISMDKGLMKSFYSGKKVIKLSGQQWLYNKIKKTKENIEYHMKQWDEEAERVHSRNEWVKQLRDSIKARQEAEPV